MRSNAIKPLPAMYLSQIQQLSMPVLSASPTPPPPPPSGGKLFYNHPLSFFTGYFLRSY